MRILDSALSLSEIEKELENYIQKNKGKIRTLGDIRMSAEDYKILLLRFRGFAQYQKNFNLYEKYSLCLLAAGSYVFENEEDCVTALEKTHLVSDQIPQYMQRRLAELFDSTLKEFNLSFFGLRLEDLHTLIEILLLHSYTDDKVYQTYFSLLDQILEEECTTEIGYRIFKKAFPRESEILDWSVKETIISKFQSSYFDCRSNKLTWEQILNKHNDISYLYISSCYAWCRGSNENQKIKIVR